MADIARLRSKVNRLLAARSAAKNKVIEAKQALQEAKQQLEAAQEAQKHLQSLAQETQQLAHKKIASIVSKCLSSVFGDLYQLQIEFVQARGKTEARLFYTKEGKEINPLVTSGGVLDVSALSLRIASIVLAQPRPRKFLCLDEPFTGVSIKNLPKACALLDAMASELKMQFLIATHVESLWIGKVIQF